MKPAFYVLGAALDFIGIMLIASPDLVPGAVRIAARARQWERTTENRLRRLVRLKPRPHFVNISATIEGRATLSGSGITSFRDDADATEKLEYLLRRDRESQEAFNSLARRVETIEAETPARLEQLRDEMQTHVDARLTSRLADLRAARLWGVVALLSGLIIGTIANLLS